VLEDVAFVINKAGLAASGEPEQVGGRAEWIFYNRLEVNLPG